MNVAFNLATQRILAEPPVPSQKPAGVFAADMVVQALRSLGLFSIHVDSNLAPADTNALWLDTGDPSTQVTGVLKWFNGTIWTPLNAATGDHVSYLNRILSSSIPNGSITNAAFASMTGAGVKGATAAGPVVDLTPTQLTAMLDVATTTLKGLMSDADKTKLDGLANYTGFKGYYASLAALSAAHATGATGEWAIISKGAGVSAAVAIWDGDNTTPAWVDTAGAAVGIGPGSVGTAELADDAVTTAKLADTAVTAAKISDDAVTNAKLADDAVETAQIKDANVTAAKLATDAVETAKIKDLNVTTAKIAADAITNAKIADGAVNGEHFASTAFDALTNTHTVGIAVALAGNTSARFVLARNLEVTEARTSPPGGAVNGALYYVQSPGAGAWAGLDGQVVTTVDGGATWPSYGSLAVGAEFFDQTATRMRCVRSAGNAEIIGGSTGVTPGFSASQFTVGTTVNYLDTVAQSVGATLTNPGISIGGSHTLTYGSWLVTGSASIADGVMVSLVRTA